MVRHCYGVHHNSEPNALDVLRSARYLLKNKILLIYLSWSMLTVTCKIIYFCHLARSPFMDIM